MMVKHMHQTGIALLLGALLLMPAAAPAAEVTPALKIAPLQYQETIPLGKIKQGFIDISNPTNQTLHLSSSVQAFRQVDTAGHLQFYESERMRLGIIPELSTFDLGPREAIRMKFTIDPIFVRTIPDASANQGNRLITSARIGTLMILTIGTGGVERGTISRLEVPFFNFGSGIKGSLDYKNSGPSAKSVAFKPMLTAKVGFWGSAEQVKSSLVLPDSTRRIQVEQKGSYIGFIPVKIASTNTKTTQSTTTYIIAMTGYWRILAVLLVIGISLVSMWIFRRLKS